MADSRQPRELRFSAGMNNLNTALDLYQRQKGEVPLMVNVDTTLPSVLQPLRTLLPLNSTPGTNIHSIFAGNNVIFAIDGTGLKYITAGNLSALFTLASSNKVSWNQAGNWIFLANGTDKQSIYIPTPVVCDWGQAIPTVAPTVVEGIAGNPNGTYSCYYRYRVTLPDGTLVLTALSPIKSITVASKKLEWTVPSYPSFDGGTVQMDLFRTSTSFSGNYKVTTLTSPTLTFSDNLTDAALQLLTAYDETGHYPPPAGANLVKYYAAADRVFCTIGGDAYWSETGMYHIFIYSAAANEYENVNSVFLSGENITAVKQIDENLYFGSTGTWRRLRGRNPSSWMWEDTSAIAGPINDASAAETPWGIIHPGKDGKMWIFNGINSRTILEEFVFATAPVAATAHATFDGRFYRLFYGDTTYPELVVDFLKYPSVPPRIVQSTRSATASYYDKQQAKFYMADVQYVRNGANTSSNIAMTFKTPDIPMDTLTKMGGQGMLYYKANTQGDNMTITPSIDGTDLSAITVNTSSNQRGRTPIPFGDGYTMALSATITSTKAVRIEEPWILTEES